MTGEDRARLDTGGAGQAGWLDRAEEHGRMRVAAISTLCLVAAGLIAGIGWMVFGLV